MLKRREDCMKRKIAETFQAKIDSEAAVIQLFRQNTDSPTSRINR